MAQHPTVKDANEFFQVNPVTRQVKVPTDQKAIGVVGDHLSEQLTFMIPSTIDEHDVANCDRKYITWKNAIGEVGHDELTCLETVDDYVYLVWNIRNALTVAKGLVEFSVHLECLADDGEAVDYRWSTATCKSCEILDAVNAELGTYAAIWVAGDTLVIEDYTPVEDGALALETPGIVPEGTLEINEAGVYEVGRYAQVRVINEESTPDSNGTIVNNSSKTVYVDYVVQDQTNVVKGVKDMTKVELAPGASLHIENGQRFTRVSVYIFYTADIYGSPMEMPTRAGLAFGALTGCSNADISGTWYSSLVASVDGREFSIEIVNE